jgi:hypothetical protein
MWHLEEDGDTDVRTLYYAIDAGHIYIDHGSIEAHIGHESREWNCLLAATEWVEERERAQGSDLRLKLVNWAREGFLPDDAVDVRENIARRVEALDVIEANAEAIYDAVCQTIVSIMANLGIAGAVLNYDQRRERGG